MGAISLVEKDIEKGRRIVELLDENSFPVTAAVWAYVSEYDRWSLMIATPRYKEDSKEDYEGSRQAYVDMSKIILDAGGPGMYPDTGIIELVAVDNPIIKALHEQKEVRGIGEVRVRAIRADGGFVEDALVYRNAA